MGLGNEARVLDCWLCGILSHGQRMRLGLDHKLSLALLSWRLVGWFSLNHELDLCLSLLHRLSMDLRLGMPLNLDHGLRLGHRVSI